ncbi:IclR family transcriptional regulator [Rhodovastum atsumiense]|uniref:IclR family transcriptional regulator n=1 Tax=Rhodovastum atsumiense TaxID=504468 RepID=A0A5M6IUL2_9PROT|nr:IclR family transcriptional regulator [Rhodovastum atsumiense]KAA5611952.1 IclR family transcriptional regulator [Rhodovastum atsumiense]CAH2598718.1 IclR family transcriptional regulator [Rhodovastum atsumiense]
MQQPLSRSGFGDPADDRRQSSADKALEILMALGELTLKSGGGIRLTDLVDHVGHPRPTVHRLLGDLKRSGFAIQEDATGRYRLGPKLLLLSAQCLGGLDIRRVAQPLLRELVEETGHTAHLGIMDKQWVVFIDKVEATRGIRIVSTIGQRREITATALGKALLAHSPRRVAEERIAEGLPKRTPNSIDSGERLFEELERTRARGFAIDDEECDLGIRCVAAPIFDHLGAVTAAISVTMMIPQADWAEVERIGTAARQVAGKITAGLGGVDPSENRVGPERS